MSSRAFSSILSLLVLSLVRGEVPSGFRLDVRPDCGSDGIEDAIIRVVTDMTVIYASVKCLNGTFNMTTTDSVHFDLPVSYTQNRSQCVFMQRNGDLDYVVLSVSYGEPDRETEFRSLTYTISCSFASHGDNLTLGHEVINGLIAPQQLVNVVGQDSNASLSLTLLDVLGNDITGTSITIGKRIQIKLEAGDTVGSGIYPVSCYGSSADRKYDILRAGCGDGVIFPKSVGFTTTGNVSYSPYFKAFGFVEAPSLFAIECVVAECTSNCDGDSCRNSKRRRREAENDDNQEYYVAVTSTKTLIDPTPLQPTDQQPDDTSISVENSQSGNNVEAGLPKVVASQTSSKKSDSSKNGYEFYGSVIYHEAEESPSRHLNPPLQKDENIPVDPMIVGKVYGGIIGEADDSVDEDEYGKSSQEDVDPQTSALNAEDSFTAEDANKPLPVQNENIRVDSQENVTQAPNSVLDSEDDITDMDAIKPLTVQTENIPAKPVRLNSAKHSLTANPKESDEDKHGHISQKDSTGSQNSVKGANEGLTAKNKNQLQSEDENIQDDHVRVTTVYHQNTTSKFKDSDENENGKLSQTVKQRIVSKPKDSNNEGEQHKQRKGATEPQASIITVTTNSTEDVEYRPGKSITMTGAAQNETLRDKLQMQQSDRVSTQGMPKSPRNPQMPSYRTLNGQSRIIGLMHPRVLDDLKQSKTNQTEASKRNQSNSKTNNSTKSLQKHLVRSDIGRAKTPLMHVFRKGEESSQTTPNATLSDVFMAKDNLPVHKKEPSHALSKPIAMYVVGTVIVALFSLANIALAISLCKRQD